MANEATATDRTVRKLVEQITTNFSEQQSNNPEIALALLHASKQGKNGIGKPDFFFMAGSYPVVIEDKPAFDRGAYVENGEIVLDYPYTKSYADNGAAWYAKNIVEKSIYHECFAIGATGDSRYLQLQPYHVFLPKGESKAVVRKLNPIVDLTDFSEANISEYYRVEVLGEKTVEQQHIENLQTVAAQLHEDLRNYASLEGENKATVISALLLALSGEPNLLTIMQGSNGEDNQDGDKVFAAIKVELKSSHVKPSDPNAVWNQKINILLNKFGFIRTNVMLNKINPSLNMTPLKYFATTLEQKVLEHFQRNTDFDVLGNFYGEFVKYGGSDGNSLGIVLTPQHITSLMAELIDVQPTDFILDPACGSAGFLISAMHRMLNAVDGDETKKTDIRQNHLYGIELQEKLFTVATTNMILRGDGKSNLRLGDMFSFSGSEFQEKGINKILFNPPYSQAKNKTTQHLSELNFIRHALDMSVPGGKLAVIVPQSTMIGKTKYDKQLKKEILDKNTLESVITLNPDTFYGIGVNPVIAIITAGKKHSADHAVTFVDFRDDGYKVSKHIGLMPDGSEKAKRKKLVQLINGNLISFENKFALKTTITAEDEWLHSFYYFNDEIPTDADFEKTIQDYLAFKFDMTVHGRGDLFNDESR
ncbi:HsdM family class I SAM-dependent methyltransferase [Lacticaseibacillus saniviri]